jgi:hypothetical protein
MNITLNIGCFSIFFIFFSSLLANSSFGEEAKINGNLDLKIKRFLESHFRDQNRQVQPTGHID